MAQSIRDALGELPSGEVYPYSVDDVVAYLREWYVESDDEQKRMSLMSYRLDRYRDDSQSFLEETIRSSFNDAGNIEEMLKFAPYALFQNVIKRVVNEISTVYSEEATRSVSGDNDVYQEVLRTVDMDRKMRKVNRYVNLLNECLVMFRVNRVSGMPQLDVITPDRFIAIEHPLDPTRMIAAMFYIGTGGDSTEPAWSVWTPVETFQLDSRGGLVVGSWTDHGLGLFPGVLVHREVPDYQLLDSTSGRDLVSAHDAVALLNVMMVKEQKSGTKASYVTGDISNTATGQRLGTETMAVFEDGTSPGVLDLGSDPSNYISACRSVINQVAANYGISESVFDLSYQASSGFEIELKRVGLREKRMEQIMDFKPVERHLVGIMSSVLAATGSNMRFDADQWTINFGETDTPQDPMQRLLYWEKLRQMSLGNTVDMMNEINPEYSEEQSMLAVMRNIDLETARVEAMKRQQQLNGGPDAEVGEPTPEENGADGQVSQAEEV